MSVVEWLRRLNLDHYCKGFIENKIFFVSDLRLLADDEGSFEGVFGIKDVMDLKRIMGMMHGDKLVRQDFGLLTTN